jgi:predicted Zn-dependent protease
MNLSFLHKNDFLILMILFAELLIAFLALSGCAVNPATGQTELMLLSEEQEFRMGRGVDKQVREEAGVYLELPELRSFVKSVGENIGRNSDRPNLIYRIEIVDLPDFNAFALPGGFVYVHRGLLERMNSADELASVLGHEIAHVAARHSAAQISKAQLFNIGLLGLTVATRGALQDYSGFINLGAALSFNKFSRDDEREADYFGTRYMVRAGYNPGASIDAMKTIQRLQAREPSALEVWFMTHPPTSERIVNLNEEIQDIRLEKPEALTRPIRRNQYIALLDGLAVGEWNGIELVSGDHYYNKEFLLSVEIPEGWHARINSKNYTVIFAQQKMDFYALFNIEPLRTRETSRQYFSEFAAKLSKAGLKPVSYSESDQSLLHGALRGIFRGYDSKRGAVLAEGMAFVEGSNGYSLLGFCKERDFQNLQPLVEGMLNSLRFISQKEASEIQPPRLRIQEAVSGDTWERITRSYFGSTSGGAVKLAEYNGFEVSQQPEPGTLIKIPPSLRLQ